MNTFYKAALFSCVAFSSTQTIDVREAFRKHENKFMEYVFIDSFNNAKAAINNTARSIVEILGTCAIAYRLYCLQNTKPEETSNSNSSQKPRMAYAEAFAKALLPEATPENALKTICAAASAYCAYTSYQSYAECKSSVIVLTNFLKEWDLNQEYTPESFHPFFEELANIYDLYGEEVFYDCAPAIVDGLQFIIKRTELKVSEVYKKEFENNASGSSIFDTPKFLGDILKHTKEIIKL